MNSRLSATFTFLFTDIEGSTRRWESDSTAMGKALAQHDLILRQSIENAGGSVFKTVGDAFYAVFPSVEPALKSALAAQRRLSEAAWEGEPLRVRMALHSGPAEERDGDYFGPTLNRIARLLGAGHGGQILVSQVVKDELSAQEITDYSLRDLGERRLKDLITPQHIFQVVSPDLSSEFPPLRTLDSRPNNLPTQPTTLIGREEELAAARTLVRRSGVQLVTLTGPAGTGKTRLALQLAAELLDEFEDGVYFVELETVNNPNLVLPTIAAVLGLVEAPASSLVDQLKDYLRSKRLLLVLDNCEQVLAAAPQVSSVLRSSNSLKVLATSRAPLHLYGEHDFSVPTMALPDTGKPLPPLDELVKFGAVALFVQRAQAVKGNFKLTEANAEAIVAICRRLDGLPLAIELAAARSKLFPPATMLPLLEQRMSLLIGGATDLPDRQRSLRGAFDWGYHLLTEAEQQLFRRLAVFVGGFMLPAVKVITGDGAEEGELLEGVVSLTDKSFLRQDEDAEGELRFFMLETVREYAVEKLTENGDLTARQQVYADYYLDMAEKAAPLLNGTEQVLWLQRLEQEYANMRAILDWCRSAEERTETGLRLALALSRFWEIRGYLTEGRSWLETNITAAGTGLREWRMRAYGAASTLAVRQGDFARSLQLAKYNLDLARELQDMPDINDALNRLAIAIIHQGNHSQAEDLCNESLQISRSLGRERHIGIALNNLALIANRKADYNKAQSYYEEALTIYTELGDKQRQATTLANMANVVKLKGRYDEAISIYEQSLLLLRELGDKNSTGIVLANLGNIYYGKGDYLTAQSLYEESLTLRQSLNDYQGIGVALYNLGEVAYSLGQFEQAASLLRESLNIATRLDNKQRIAGTNLLLTKVLMRQGNYMGIEGQIRQILTYHLEQNSKLDIVISVETLGLFYKQTGELLKGLQLLGAADSLRTALGVPRSWVEQTQYMETLNAIEKHLTPTAFAEGHQTGRNMGYEQVMNLALENSM